MSFIRVALLGWAAILLLGGCATAPEAGSSTPWNVPQPWENTLPLPLPLQ